MSDWRDGVDIDIQSNFDQTGAVRLCKEKLDQSYGYRDVRNISTKEKGNDYYKIKGRVRSGGAKSSDKHFVCRVDDKRVIFLEVTDSRN